MLILVRRRHLHDELNKVETNKKICRRRTTRSMSIISILIRYTNSYLHMYAISCVSGYVHCRLLRVICVSTSISIPMHYDQLPSSLEKGHLCNRASKAGQEACQLRRFRVLLTALWHRHGVCSSLERDVPQRVLFRRALLVLEEVHNLRYISITSVACGRADLQLRYPFDPIHEVARRCSMVSERHCQ